MRVALPAAERALYVELKNHLEALDMKNNHKTIKSKCKSENDREARLAQVRAPLRRVPWMGILPSSN